MKPRFARQTAKARRQSLIDAALACLREGGIAHFTIDNISKQAGVSRGLINHHFDGIEDLLVSVYENMTAAMGEVGRAALAVAGGAEERLVAVIDTMFTPPMFSKSGLRAWLALWGEVAINARLKASHRKSYDRYRKAMAQAISEIAQSRRIGVDAEALAATTIALIDGLWIEWCLDSSVVSREFARRSVFEVIEARLGPLQR